MLKNRRSQKVIPAIMIGGSGTRLWPLSRANKPKQFLRLTRGTRQSFFQQTISRFEGPLYSPPWLMSAEETLIFAEQQLDEIGKEPIGGVIVEPSVQGTAAAITALSAAIATMHGRGADAVILVAPSDHLVKHPERFNEAVAQALPLAADGGRIVTFGIEPTEPETGFGYIRPGRPLLGSGETAMSEKAAACGYGIDQGGFLEKPDIQTAKQFLQDGYLWNAGIFLFRADVMLEEMLRYAPKTYDAATQAVERSQVETTGTYIPRILLDKETFAKAPEDIPVDKAVMEVSDKGAVAPCSNIGWSDIGALSSLYDSDPRKDAWGNVLDDKAIVLSSSNNLVRSENGRKIVLIGVEELAVIDDEDVVLVVRKDMAQEVKSVVRLLKEKGQPQHRALDDQVFSWGRVQINSRVSSPLVFSLVLRPGAILELQMPLRGWENWLLSQGEVLVWSGGRERRLKMAGSLTTGSGDVVRIENTGPDKCVFIITRHRPGEEAGTGVWDVSAETVLTVLSASNHSEGKQHVERRSSVSVAELVGGE
ncbi:mannose-1-phosphate guanylyltransferase [Roseibium sp.]|uniref:mannose-1-phosphate guanylyltransferase n=1 Tax=Roseibium sp. TaxID=1936156 RepID=UPI003A97C41D